MFWRLTAQRLIVETKNKEVLPELYKIIGDQSVDEIGLNAPAIHALWTLHGLGELNGENREAEQVVEKALRHPSGAVRKNALRVIPRTETSLKAIMASNLLSDPDLHARKYAFLTLSEMPFNEDAAKELVKSADAADNGTDAYLPQAIFAAVLSHPTEFAKRDNKAALQVEGKLKCPWQIESVEAWWQSNIPWIPETPFFSHRK